MSATLIKTDDYSARAEMTTVDDTVISTEQILDFYLQKDRFTIVDLLSFTVIGNITAKIKKVKFYIKNNLVFDGIVDSKKSVYDVKGRYTTIVCRSKFAQMIDNEIEPRIYNNFSKAQLVEKFLTPYGLSGEHLSDGVADIIIADKGFCAWEFIEQFCFQVYKKRPYINAQNQVVLNVFTDEVYNFSENHQESYPYHAITVSDDRYNMISKMIIKRPLNGITYYSHVLNNPSAQGLGVERVRYLDSPEADPLTHANFLMHENHLDFFEIELELIGLLNVNVGDCGQVYLDDNWYQYLYISQVKLCGDTNGLSTKIKLWDRVTIG